MRIMFLNNTQYQREHFILEAVCVKIFMTTTFLFDKV